MSWILDQVREGITKRQDHLQKLLQAGNTFRVYDEVNRIASEVGSKFHVRVFLNFPDKRNLLDLTSIGSRGMSILLDSARKKFSRQSDDRIRQELLKQMPDARLTPASFGHEGFHADLKLGRLTVLPSGVHVWCEADLKTRRFLDWLFSDVYGISPTGSD